MGEIPFSDERAKEDHLDSEAISGGLTRLVEIAAKPFVLAVIGEWGSGKTTLIDKSLRNLEDSYEIVEFDSWFHSKGTSLLQALFSQLLEKVSGLEKDKESSVWQGVKEKVKNLTENPIVQAVPRFFSPAMNWFGVCGEQASTALQAIAADGEVDVESDPAETLVEQFEEIAGDFKKRGKELLIFIDDLDRCTPTQALDLIDDIKVYLTVTAPVTFIVALDRRTLQMGIKAKYGVESEVSVDDYLQKIFSYAFYMPQFSNLITLIDDVILSVTGEEESPFTRIANDCIEETGLSNLRAIKKVVRRWVYIVGAKEWRSLPRRKAKLKLKEVNVIWESFYGSALLLCMLAELYPEHYELLASNRELLPGILQHRNYDAAPFYEHYIRKQRELIGNSQATVKKLESQDEVLTAIYKQLACSGFVRSKDEHYAHLFKEAIFEAYTKLCDSMIQAVTLGLPLSP